MCNVNACDDNVAQLRFLCKMVQHWYILSSSSYFLEYGDKGFPLPVIDGVTLVSPKVFSGEVIVSMLVSMSALFRYDVT